MNIVVNPQLSYYMELGALLTEAKTITNRGRNDEQCLDNYYDAIKNLASSNNDTKLNQILNRSFVQKLTPGEQCLVKRNLIDTLLQIVINATAGMTVPVPDVIKVVADPKTFQGLMIVPGEIKELPADTNTAKRAIELTK